MFIGLPLKPTLVWKVWPSWILLGSTFCSGTTACTLAIIGWWRTRSRVKVLADSEMLETFESLISGAFTVFCLTSTAFTWLSAGALTALLFEAWASIEALFCTTFCFCTGACFAEFWIVFCTALEDLSKVIPEACCLAVSVLTESWACIADWLDDLSVWSAW